MALASAQKSHDSHLAQLHLFSLVFPAHQDSHGGGAGGGEGGGEGMQKPQPAQVFHPHFVSSELVFPSHQFAHGEEGGAAGGDGG